MLVNDGATLTWPWTCKEFGFNLKNHVDLWTMDDYEWIQYGQKEVILFVFGILKWK